MRLLAMLTVAGCALTAAAQDFQLQSDPIPSGTNTASVVNEPQQRARIFAAMQAIVIPEMDFRDADLRDVILFLANASREMTTNPFQVGFIVKGYDQTLFDSSDTNRASCAMADVPKITFSAMGITLKEALDVVVEMARCKYLIRNGTIMILPDYYSEDCWVSYYDMTEASINRLEELALQLKRDDPDSISEGTLKALFEHMGVTWPEGSYIKPSPILGKLIVRNTEENLEVFYKCLSVMDVQPYQMEIELAFLACERRQISALGPDGMSAAALTALWTNGQAELLAAPRVLTQPGQKARIQGMTGEYLGASLQVIPVVSPGGKLIEVILNPEFAEAPGGEQVGGGVMAVEGTSLQANMPPPLHNYAGELRVLVANGKRVLVGGGVPSRDGQRLIYMLLTARKVSTAGDALP